MGNGRFTDRSGRVGYRKMAAYKAGRSDAGPIACNLSAEQKANSESDFAESGLDLGELTDAVVAGYKLSITAGNDGRTFYATLTDKADSSEFEGSWLTIRSNDPIKAIFRVLWITGTLCEGDWSQLEQIAHEIGDEW